MPNLFSIHEYVFVAPVDVRDDDEVLEPGPADLMQAEMENLRDGLRAEGQIARAEKLEAQFRTEARNVCVRRRVWPENSDEASGA